jgi:hypothetical protein
MKFLLQAQRGSNKSRHHIGNLSKEIMSYNLERKLFQTHFNFNVFYYFGVCVCTFVPDP